MSTKEETEPKKEDPPKKEEEDTAKKEDTAAAKIDTDVTAEFIEKIEFPTLEDSAEMARLSKLAYKFLGKQDDEFDAKDDEGNKLMPDDLDFHLYRHVKKSGTQVMVVSSESKKYIAVSYAGTDDFKTTLMDAKCIVLRRMGGHENQHYLEGEGLVHGGFDKCVFADGLFELLKNKVQESLKEKPDYRVFTTGHSLGAANSVLTAVAFTKTLPENTKITCLNFGCPACGDVNWRDEVNQLCTTDRLKIWRFVYGKDCVPRMPPAPYFHVGHTLQMQAKHMRAFYEHDGKLSLGYAGVPTAWNLRSVLVESSLTDHKIDNYVSYLKKAADDEEKLYVNSFEKNTMGPISLFNQANTAAKGACILQ